jgi:hypothetical protein
MAALATARPSLTHTPASMCVLFSMEYTPKRF